jgi:hypothetical protein
MMNVTGYQLKEALKMKTLELSTVQTQFDESLHKFEGDEDKISPQEIVGKIASLEEEIAELQTAQSYYNLQVTIHVGDLPMKLEKAIKLVGGAGRVSKMWRSASKGQMRERWERHSLVVRRADEEVAKPTISKNEALDRAKEAERFASRLRNSIAVGNTTTVAIDWLDESLIG